MINHCYRVLMKRTTYIQKNVKTAGKLGGSNIIATLSQILTYNSYTFIFTRERVTCDIRLFLLSYKESLYFSLINF